MTAGQAGRQGGGRRNDGWTGRPYNSSIPWGVCHRLRVTSIWFVHSPVPLRFTQRSLHSFAAHTRRPGPAWFWHRHPICPFHWTRSMPGRMFSARNWASVGDRIAVHLLFIIRRKPTTTSLLRVPSETQHGRVFLLGDPSPASDLVSMLFAFFANTKSNRRKRAIWPSSVALNLGT